MFKKCSFALVLCGCDGLSLRNVMLVVQLVVLSMIGVGPGFVSLSSEEESVSVSSLLDIVWFDICGIGMCPLAV